MSFVSSCNFIVVVPIDFAVIVPSSATVAMLLSIDVNVIFSVGIVSVNKLNPIFALYFICFVSFMFSILIILFSLTSIFNLLIDHGVLKFCTVSFAISPLLLYPTVHTFPSSFIIAPVCGPS